MSSWQAHHQLVREKSSAHCLIGGAERGKSSPMVCPCNWVEYWRWRRVELIRHTNDISIFFVGMGILRNAQRFSPCHSLSLYASPISFVHHPFLERNHQINWPLWIWWRLHQITCWRSGERSISPKAQNAWYVPREQIFYLH